MSWFTDLDTSYQLCIVLGCLLVLTLLVGFIKVYVKKRKIAKIVRQGDLEANTSKQPEVQQNDLGEGDFFGVRALEHGYFGGVAQSRPASPVSSQSLSFANFVPENSRGSVDMPITALSPRPMLSRPHPRQSSAGSLPPSMAIPMSPPKRSTYVPKSPTTCEASDNQPERRPSTTYSPRRDETLGRSTFAATEVSKRITLHAESTSDYPSLSSPAGISSTSQLHNANAAQLPRVPPAVQHPSRVSDWRSQAGSQSFIEVPYYQPNRSADVVSLLSTSGDDVTSQSSESCYSRTSSPERFKHHKKATSSVSTKSIKRTRDSLHTSRSMSSDKADRRRSVARDQIHYDPHTHNRDGSGSVHGRRVDFDRPRQSPFYQASSNRSTTSSRTRSSSVSSAGAGCAESSAQQAEHGASLPSPPPPVPRLTSQWAASGCALPPSLHMQSGDVRAGQPITYDLVSPAFATDRLP